MAKGQGQGLTKNLGFAQTFDFSPLVQQSIQKKKEKDAAITSVLNDISDIDVSSVRQVDMKGMTLEYSDLQDFVTENYEAISNPAKNPEVYAEYRRRKQKILTNVARSKQAAQKELSMTEELAKTDLYQSRYQENTSYIKNLHSTSIYSIGDDGYSLNDDFDKALNVNLKAGTSFNDLAKDYATDIETEGDSFYVTQQNGEKLLVVKNGKISDENLMTYAKNVLGSNKGSLALGEKFQYDNGFESLTPEQQEYAAQEFVNAMKPFLPSELKVSGLGDAEGAGDEDLFVPRDRYLVSHLFGETGLVGLATESGPITSSNTLGLTMTNGETLVLLDYDTELGEGQKQENRAVLGVIDAEGNFRNTNIDTSLVSDEDAYLVQNAAGADETVRMINDNLNRESGKNEVSNEEYMKRWNARTMADAFANSVNDKRDRGENLFSNHNVMTPVREVVFNGQENVSLSSLSDKFTSVFNDLHRNEDKVNETIMLDVNDKPIELFIERKGGAEAYDIKFNGETILSSDELSAAIGGDLFDPNNTTPEDRIRMGKTLYNRLYNGYLKNADYMRKSEFFDNLYKSEESVGVGTSSVEEKSTGGDSGTISIDW